MWVLHSFTFLVIQQLLLTYSLPGLVGSWGEGDKQGIT